MRKHTHTPSKGHGTTDKGEQGGSRALTFIRVQSTCERVFLAYISPPSFPLALAAADCGNARAFLPCFSPFPSLCACVRACVREAAQVRPKALRAQLTPGRAFTERLR